MSTGEREWKRPYPPFRKHPLRWLRWHLRENWTRAWEIGPIELEIEWGPKARYYTFTYCWSRPRPEDYR